MHKINFMKMVASGNDFVVCQFASLPVCQLKKMAQKICDRKFGIGADGSLVLGKSKIADVKMRIFNPDGSEAEMCGNGARCVALYSAREQRTENREQRKINIETKAGIIEAKVNGENVRIKLTEPKNLKLNIPTRVNNRTLRVNFINTGVPHTVIFVTNLDKIDVLNLGRKIRFHKRFSPQGTNVDFVEVLNSDSLKVRAYERGVEDETLACGTGAVASALITDYRLSRVQLCKEVTLRDPEVTQKQTLHSGPITDYRKINVHTKSGEILKVYFDRVGDSFENVWLEGKAKIVYRGVYDV